MKMNKPQVLKWVNLYCRLCAVHIDTLPMHVSENDVSGRALAICDGCLPGYLRRHHATAFGREHKPDVLTQVNEVNEGRAGV